MAAPLDVAMKDLKALQKQAGAAYVAGDYAKARNLYYQLSSVGSKYAQYRLSILYYLGQGVDQDWPLAYAWANVAAEGRQDSLLQHKKTVWESIPNAERDTAMAAADKYMQRFNDAAVARTLWIRSRQKKLASIGRGLFPDSLVVVKAPCDNPSAGGDAGAVVNSPKIFADNAGPCSGMAGQVSDPFANLNKLRNIEWIMQDRVLGGSVELRDFQVIENDVTNASADEQTDAVPADDADDK